MQRIYLSTEFYLGLALSLVANDIGIALHQLLQFLLAGGDGEGSAIGVFHAEAGVRNSCCALGDIADLLGVELSLGKAQLTGVAPLLSPISGFE